LFSNHLLFGFKTKELLFLYHVKTCMICLLKLSCMATNIIVMNKYFLESSFNASYFRVSFCMVSALFCVTIPSFKMVFSLSLTIYCPPLASYIRDTPVLSSYLHLGLPCGLFSSGFPTEVSYAFLNLSHVCYVPCPYPS
jgi:hypothetical protein